MRKSVTIDEERIVLGAELLPIIESSRNARESLIEHYRNFRDIELPGAEFERSRDSEFLSEPFMLFDCPIEPKKVAEVVIVYEASGDLFVDLLDNLEFAPISEAESVQYFVQIDLGEHCCWADKTICERLEEDVDVRKKITEALAETVATCEAGHGGEPLFFEAGGKGYLMERKQGKIFLYETSL